MASGSGDQSGARDQLAVEMEKLVDNVSGLVLSTVTGDLSNIRVNCEGIAVYTNRVVLKAKDIALDSKDRETQIDITNCINGVASSIENLVTGFTTLISDLSNPNHKQKFAEGAKNVGISLNQLVVATDGVACKQVLRAVENGKIADQQLLRSIAGDRNAMLSSARVAGESMMEIHNLGTYASTNTADTRKAGMLAHAVTEYKSQLTDLIRQCGKVGNTNRIA